LSLAISALAQSSWTADETTCDLVQRCRYSCQQLSTTTSDGYVLGVHQVRNPSCSSFVGVVFLMHGLLDTSATWFINSPSESLGFILADHCYDVYGGNVRGNRYSQENTNWNSHESQFWAFDWDQHAAIDIPSMLAAIRSWSGKEVVHFIGHSQGGTTGIAAMSSYGVNFGGKVVFLAPVTYLSHCKSTVLKLMSLLNFNTLYSLIGDLAFQPTPGLLKTLLGATCSLTPELCNNFAGMLFGVSTSQNASRADVYSAHWPDVTSVRNLVHWLNNTRTGLFANYDGVPYQPHNLNTQVSVFYGGGDLLADSADVQTLIGQFSSVTYQSEIGSFTHMDFTWSDVATQPVYNEILTLLS